MIRPFRLLFLLVLLVLTVSVASAQVPTGTPPFGSFGGGPDVINLANLNSHISIPLLNKPGRGTNFTYDLSYDSSVWYPVTSGSTTSWQPVANYGWAGQTQISTGYVSYSRLTGDCGTGHGRVPYYIYTFRFYNDQFGTPHPINLTVNDSKQKCSVTINPFSATATLNDGSGYKVSVDASPSTTVYSSRGTIFSPPLLYGTGAGSFTDRNGNQITVNTSGQFFDTLSSTTPVLTVAGTGTPIVPMTFTYVAPSGALAAYTVHYTNYTVATNFVVSGISEYKSLAAVPLISSIVLPDGSQYTFLYEATPSTAPLGACTPYAGTTCVTARVTSITLPGGGSITYAYTGGAGTNNSGIFSDGSTATLTRTVAPGGTWIYAQVKNTGAASTTTVSDPTTPTANQTIIQFQNIYETQRQVYQGSTSGTLLTTTNTCYNASSSPCNSTAVALPITQRSVISTFPGTGSLQSQHIDKYGTSGSPTETDDYSFGPGAPGALLRQVLYTYAPLGNITAFTQQITVKNGAGATVAQTNYNYDETAVVTPTNLPTPQHAVVTGSRGNLTSINYPAGGLIPHFTYFDTGNLQTSKDVNGAVTTYNFGALADTCGNAFPSSASVTQPISMSTSATWNCAGGVQLTATDANSKITTTAYTDPYFWRPASTSFPDGGQASVTYNSSTSVTTTAKMNSSQNIVSTVLLDGLGRNKQTQLNSDPEGVDYTDTTYDVLGPLGSVSNTYRSTGDSTYGITTYRYDALGRPTMVIPPDGSSSANNISASYSSNTTTVIDQAGKKRQSTLDSLGRPTQITEDPGGLGYVTTYSYDALSNLTGATQNGSRQRSFTYDALSRLVCESNPEIQIATCPNPDNGSYTAGTIRYNYNTNGDLATRIAPAPNQTGSATVTTTYQYDALHRLTMRSYNDGTTPTANYYYDQQAPWGWNLSNYIGRLTTQSTSSGSANLYNYDPVGRPVLSESCTPLNCAGTSYAVQYSYDFAGNMLSMPVSKGSNFFTASYSYDTAGRPISVTSNLVDSQHPATLATIDSLIGYYPAGILRKMTYGNSLTGTAAFNSVLEICRFNVNSSGAALGACADGIPSGNVQDFNYGFNAGSTNNGNVASWAATGQQAFNRSFGYDSLNRLSTLNQSSGNATGCSSTFNLSWTYDAWGNRTDQTLNSGTCNPFHSTVNTKNQLVDPINNKYQYDAAGNMIQDANHTYFYDAESRLIQVDSTLGTCSTATACYIYDAGGLRVESNHGSWQMDYLHDLSGNVVADWETSSGYTGWATGYVYLNGGLLAQYQGATTHFAHADHLGSTRLLTGLNQAVVQNLDYLPYGELNSSDSGINTHQFTGDERDSETGLDHTWFRQYSSSLGRWMHPDPAGLAAVDISNPQSWNRYAYVLNSPLNLIDPLGLDGCVDKVAPDGSVNTVCTVSGGGGGGFNPCVLPGACGGGAGGGSGGGGGGGGRSGGAGGTVSATPMLTFKPPSWHNFTHEFLPCYGGQVIGNLVGDKGKATVTFGTVALRAKNPLVGGVLLVIWTGINEFKAGAACALASRAVYQ